MTSQFRFVTVALLSLAVGSGAARAELPLPAFPDCGLDRTSSACPSDATKHDLWDFTPVEIEDRIEPVELDQGVGNGTTAAWRVSTGRWDQVVAVADSGARWEELSFANKVLLNTAELPLPQDASGTEAATYDLDGNGIVNLADYAQDPRVAVDAGAWRADDVLDPSDLIHTFSDGVDDDANGYIDDIAGWDFFERDNDPFATNQDSYGDHGTGVLEAAAAEGGDGGPIGVCPNCGLLPIRTGDSFITTGNILGEALVFARDHGAVAIAMATGGFGDTGFTNDAIEWAWQDGLILVAAAGDETSFHRNRPAVNARSIYVTSVEADRGDWEDATTFQRFVNCNNFGARKDLVATVSHGCATASVARITGGVGLIRSVAEELGVDPPLSNGELRQLLLQTTDDIDHPESRGPDADEKLFPSYPGWDQFFGYGRVDFGQATAALAQGAIPPEAEITSPSWFEYIRQPVEGVDTEPLPAGAPSDAPDVVDGSWTPRLGVSATISSRAGSFDWRLDWAVGTEIPEEGWIEAATGHSDGPVDGPIAWLPIHRSEPAAAGGCGGGEPGEAEDRIFEAIGLDTTYDVDPLPYGATITERAAMLDPYAVTLRLTVTAADGTVATARRQVFVRYEPALLPGFPKHLPAAVETSPALSDLDGDGRFEIVLAGSDGTVYAWDGAGEALPGWPVQVGLAAGFDPADPDNHRAASAFASGALDPDSVHQGILASVAVGDLGDDGSPDVVVGTLNGELYAWTAEGSLRAGFPVSMDFAHCDPADRSEDVRTDCGFFATPTLVDLDEDGQLDILQPGMDGWLYAWDGAGQPLDGWPVEVTGPGAPEGRRNRILSSPAVGDVDGDGHVEIALGTSQVAGSQFSGYGVLYLLDQHGVAEDGWPILIFAGFAGALPYVGEGTTTSPVLADIDGDGDLEIAAATLADQGAIYNHDGTVAVDFVAIQDGFGGLSNSSEFSGLFMLGNSSLGDVDGDGHLDLFNGGSGIGYGGNIAAWETRYEHEHLLLGYSTARPNGDDKGYSLAGFPQVMEDMQFFVSPLTFDLDGDGISEVVHGSHHVVRAFDAQGGQPIDGMPLFHGGWMVGTPAAGDIDGDGYRDLVVGTREGYVFAWRTAGTADSLAEWPMGLHDPQRTGNYNTPLVSQAGPEAEADGCAQAASGRSAVWLLLLIPLAARSRRRR